MVNWLRYQMAGLCVRAALHVLPRGKVRDGLAQHLDLWVTKQIDPKGTAGRVVTVHRREIGSVRE